MVEIYLPGRYQEGQLSVSSESPPEGSNPSLSILKGGDKND